MITTKLEYTLQIQPFWIIKIMEALLLLTTVPFEFLRGDSDICLILREPWCGECYHDQVKLLKGFLEVFLASAGWGFLKLSEDTWIYVVLHVYAGSKPTQDLRKIIVLIQHCGTLKSDCLWELHVGCFCWKGGSPVGTGPMAGLHGPLLS